MAANWRFESELFVGINYLKLHILIKDHAPQVTLTEILWTFLKLSSLLRTDLTRDEEDTTTPTDEKNCSKHKKKKKVKDKIVKKKHKREKKKKRHDEETWKFVKSFSTGTRGQTPGYERRHVVSLEGKAGAGTRRLAKGAMYTGEGVK